MFYLYIFRIQYYDPVLTFKIEIDLEAVILILA